MLPFIVSNVGIQQGNENISLDMMKQSVSLSEAERTRCFVSPGAAGTGSLVIAGLWGSQVERGFHKGQLEAHQAEADGPRTGG